MHYDEMQVVFYKHESDDPNEAYSVEIVSIHKCQHISTYTLQKFISCYEFIPQLIEETDKLIMGGYYLFTLKFNDAYNLRKGTQVVSVEDVSKSDNEFHRLH